MRLRRTELVCRDDIGRYRRKSKIKIVALRVVQPGNSYVSTTALIRVRCFLPLQRFDGSILGLPLKTRLSRE